MTNTQTRPVSALLLLTLFAAAPAVGAVAEAPAANFPINQRLLAQQRAFLPIPYDTHPAFVLDAAGKGYAVWHSYATGEEHVVGRVLPAGRDTPMLNVAEKRGTFGHPELATDRDGTLCLVWADYAQGRWSVFSRRGTPARWSAPVPLSDSAVEALHPSVTALGRGEFVVAWVEHRDGRFRVVAKTSPPPWRSARPTPTPSAPPSPGTARGRIGSSGTATATAVPPCMRAPLRPRSARSKMSPRRPTGA